MKIPAKIPEQINKLRSHGIGISNENHARDLLSSVNYYRLRGYWLTFNLDDGEANVNLEDIATIYEFDTELKALLWRVIEPIEIKIRTQFAYQLAVNFGADAYRNENLFKDKDTYRRSLRSLDAEIKRAKDNNVAFVCHNLKKYGDLPIWAVVELMSFGCLSKMCANLKSENLKLISAEFGINNHQFSSWTRHLVSVRNICAHHNRFYNRLMTMPPKLNKEDMQYFSYKQFPTFIVLKKFYRSLNAEDYNKFMSEFKNIVDKYNSVSLIPMGFPDNWKEVLKV